MSSKQTKENFGSNQNKPKQDLFQLCFGLFRETKNQKFRFVSVFRTYIETPETNRTVSKQTKTTLNFQKNTKICSLSNCFCLFRFNGNIDILCFSIEAKQPKQTVSKQTETNRNNPKFSEKIPKYALYQTFSFALLFISVLSKNRNSLFRYRTKQLKQSFFFFGSRQN
jgi:hypothetical protein